MAQPLISLHNAHVSLRHEGQSQRILNGITLEICAGEHIAILGANGAGKSTLLKLLRGEIWAEEADTSANSPITWHYNGLAETSPIMGKRTTALVSASKQERYVRHEWRLSGEDILLTAYSDSELLYFIPDQKQKEAVYAMAQRLKCAHLLSQEACTLSQGQLRLLMLGRALLRKPCVVLLDEYMEGLDTATRELMLGVLPQCDSTLVFTGHRESSVPSWVQHRYLLQGGKLTPLSATTTTPQAQNLSPAFASSNSLHVMDASTPSHTTVTSEPAHIIIKDSTVFIDRKPLLQDISWTWHRGEHWFLHGANGAGKSTFLRLLAGDEYVAYGGFLQRYSLRETTPVPLQDRESISRAVRLINDKEQMTYAYDIHGLELVLSGIDHVQGQYRTYSEEETHEAQSLLQTFSLTALEDRAIATLSTGQLRRLLIARALIGKPEMLLLDELFSGLDTASYSAVRHMLEELSQHVSLMLVSHYEEDSLSCINRHAYMEKGRIQT